MYVKYLAKVWRQRKREYAKRQGVSEKKRRYSPGHWHWLKLENTKSPPKA